MGVILEDPPRPPVTDVPDDEPDDDDEDED